ncbi:hypothetical protein BU15DRAFT_61880 [Melanogaster broomeanus]|nr:hypothetical protein BU15DRAFT_61880 [Melanogaster broomeanus]
MSNLPPKPDLSRAPPGWPEQGDDRRPGGGRATPDRHAHQRDDRDARDRERGSRPRYPPRSPPRSMDSYVYNQRDRDTYYARDYRGHDDSRARDNVRNDWDRDRDRDRGYYRRHPGRPDDTWLPRKDYGADRDSSSRRVYDRPPPRESDRHSREEFRRDRERGRSRDRDYSHGERRDREHDRRQASPLYRPAPLSPRRVVLNHPLADLSRRISLGEDGHLPLEAREAGLVVKPGSPEANTRLPRHPDKSHRDGGPSLPISEPVKAEDQPIDRGTVLETQMDIEPTAEPPFSKGKARSDDQDKEPHTKIRTPSPQQAPHFPLDHKQLQHFPPTAEGVPAPHTCQAYPGSEPRPKFSSQYESSRLDAHRAHAAAECRRSLKASRRALHELDMTTLELRAAQHRRELAESHRKKAHHGQLGIDAETVQ